jgi:capsular polysaccharide biosynthesis protein
MSGAAERLGIYRRSIGELRKIRDRKPPTLPVLAIVVAAIVAVSIVAALAISHVMPTVYGAQADLLVQPSGDPSGFGAERDLATQQTILQGRAVLGPVARATGIPLERLEAMVSVENPAQTNILRVTVADKDRRAAQRAAELITEQYLRNASRAGEDAPDSIAAQLQQQVESLSKTFSGTLDRLQTLARERRPGEPTTPEEQRLQAASTSMLQRIGALQDQLTALTSSRMRQADVTVVEPPHLLERPLRPRSMQALAMGTLLGLLVAVGAVLLLRRPRFRREIDYGDDYGDDGWR